MKLVHLSIVSILGCLLGLLVLLGLTLQSAAHMQIKQAEIANLLELQKRIGDFSVASDNLLLFGADARLWQAFQTEAEVLQTQLRRLGLAHPDANKAAHRVKIIVETLATVAAETPNSAADATMPRQSRLKPLAMPPRSQIVTNQIAGHGIALDTALDDVLRERQQTIAREATWIAGGFAGSALLFGALCVIAFVLIHRRVAAPARELSYTLERIRAGDLNIRAPVRGNDELANLARTLNRMLDQRQTDDAQLREQQVKLRHREQMLADSQRIARIGSWRIHLADDTLEWSDETYRIVGVSPETFVPTLQAFFEFVHPDDREQLLTARGSNQQGRRVYEAEFRIIRPDGEVRYIHEISEPQNDPSEYKDSSLAGTIQDITERRQADVRLHQYRELVESSDDMCGIADANYRYLLVNRAYANMFALEPSQIEGRYLWEILGRDYFEHNAKPKVDRCLAGETQLYETERDHAAMGRRQILARYYPIEMPGGKELHVCAVITDITELKKAEIKLREQACLLDIAGRVGRFGGWSIDLSSGRVSWSDVVANIHAMPHGYSPTIDEGINFYAPEYRDRIRSLFTACAEEGVPYDEELQLIDANGQRVWVRAVGEAMRDENGEIIKVQGAFQDISASMASKQEVQRLARRLQTTLESITDAFFILDRHWCFTYLNSEAERLLRRTRQDLLGKMIWNEFPEAVGTNFEHEYRRAMTEHITVTFEEYYPPLETWYDVRAYPSEEGLAVYFQNVTERHNMMDQLLEHEQNLRRSSDQLAKLLETRKALINSLPAHIALLDGEGTIVDVNEQWRHFGQENAYRGSGFGLGENYIAVCDNARGECADEAATVAQGLRDVLAGKRDNFTLEYPCHSSDQFRWFRIMVNQLVPSEDGGEHHGVVVMHVNITERKLAEQELNRLAYQDALTGLLSRNGFTQTLSERLGQEGWKPADMVVMLDVQGQRDVNDAYGYEAGDQLLIRLGRRFQDQIGENSLVGRIGGDEFVLFLHAGKSGPEQRLMVLAAAVKEPFKFHRISVEISIRMGYTLLGKQPRSVDSLLREAELALFQTKVDMASSWIAYTDELDQQVHQRIELTRELRGALDEEQFELHFQPKVDLETGRLLACEALLRWNHPERGLQPPGLFIPIAEQSQLISPIGDWVLREACRQLREWQDAGLEVVRVAVNVSLVQFFLGDFPQKVRDALRESKINASALTLEITESVFERESEKLLQQLKELHEMGVRLSLDDFGTGYSSLLYLQKYPFDEIKIDRAFVQHICDDPYSREIATTVMGLAGALDADVVAEGIESDAVQACLLEMGCRIGQGYYYSIPLMAEDFRWLLEKRSPLPLCG